METKPCESCGNYFKVKRVDTKFCSNKCRQENYRKKNNIEPPEFLKGIEKKKEGLGNINQEPVRLQSKVLGREYLRLNGELRIRKYSRDLIIEEKKKFMTKYNTVVAKNPQLEKLLMTLGGAVGGAMIGKSFSKEKDTENDMIVKVGLGALTFAAGGYFLSQALKETDKEVFSKLDSIRTRIADLDKKINNEYFVIVELEQKLKKVPKYVIEQPKEEKIYVPMFDLSREKQPVYASKVQEQKTEQTGNKTHSIVNSMELQDKTFETLNFTGKWANFIGKPQPNFYMTIYGKAGQGKSNFSFQLAEFLANNYGKVLYVAREEGISTTTQGKVNLNNAVSQYLDFTDMKELEDINKSISERKYRFIVLDSVSTLKLEPMDIQVLKKNHKHLGIICIQQATKSGDARGSNEFSHDADIVIEIDKGQAITVKNRFAEKANEPYNIFN
jgi:uncharacterized protein (DUF2164 family)